MSDSLQHTVHGTCARACIYDVDGTEIATSLPATSPSVPPVILTLNGCLRGSIPSALLSAVSRNTVTPSDVTPYTCAIVRACVRERVPLRAAHAYVLARVQACGWSASVPRCAGTVTEDSVHSYLVVDAERRLRRHERVRILVAAPVPCAMRRPRSDLPELCVQHLSRCALPNRPRRQGRPTGSSTTAARTHTGTPTHTPTHTARALTHTRARTHARQAQVAERTRAWPHAQRSTQCRRGSLARQGRGTAPAGVREYDAGPGVLGAHLACSG